MTEEIYQIRKNTPEFFVKVIKLLGGEVNSFAIKLRNSKRKTDEFTIKKKF